MENEEEIHKETKKVYMIFEGPWVVLRRKQKAHLKFSTQAFCTFYKSPNPLHIETSINQNVLDRVHCYNPQLPNYGGIVLFPMGVTAAAQPARIGGGYVILDGEKAHTQNSVYRFC